jgi:hypothetical protein
VAEEKEAEEEAEEEEAEAEVKEVKEAEVKEEEAEEAEEAEGGRPSSSLCGDYDYSVRDLYAQLADGGFDYGPEFRAVQSITWGGPMDHAAEEEEGGGGGGGVRGVVAQRPSPFVLDYVTLDACFHLAPLLDPLGFEGAPVSVARVRVRGPPTGTRP